MAALHAPGKFGEAQGATIVGGVEDCKLLVGAVAVGQGGAGLAVVVLGGTFAERGAWHAQEILEVETLVAFEAGIAIGAHAEAVIGDDGLNYC